jgi:hypothetical protein
MEKKENTGPTTPELGPPIVITATAREEEEGTQGEREGGTGRTTYTPKFSICSAIC